MNRVIIHAFTLAILMSHTSQAIADDDPAKLCKQAATLFEEGDLEGALEEAKWCVTQLEQLKQSQTAKYFKDKILNYTGGEISQQSAMGFTMIERSYASANKKIKVALTGGNSGGALSAFSALAQFGLQGSGTSKVRIQKRSAVVTNENGHLSMMITLKSGAMLGLESDEVTKDELVEFAKAFPIKELDNSLIQ
ncbi:hypothetical protein [Thalassotalea fusca]